MECPNCFYVAAPGEAAEQGACPNCQRPYRMQPSPTVSDGELRDMPQDETGDDMGGNPLREGILGDYDNRAKRDESFASVRVRETPYAPLWYSSSELKPDPEIPADLVDVIPEEDVPDKRKDRKLDNIESSVQKEALFRSLMSWGGGLAGGALGSLLGPEGTVAGAMLGKAAGSLVGNAIGGKLDGSMQGGGQGGQAQQPQTAPAVEDPSFYSAVAAGPSETFAPGMNKIPDANDSQDGDTKQHDDGDRSKGEQVGDGVNDGGGTDQGDSDYGGFSEDGVGRLLAMLPLLLHHGEAGTGANDPLVHALDQMLEAEQPGYKDTHTDPQAHQHIIMLFKGGDKGDKGDSMSTDDNETQPDGHTTESIHTALQQPGLMNNPAQTTMRPNDAAMGNHCAMCGGTLSPSNPTCPQCGAPNARAQVGGLGQAGMPGVTAADMPRYLENGQRDWYYDEPGVGQPNYVEFPDIPPNMSIKDWTAAGRPIHCPNCGNPTVDRESRTCSNCGEYKHFAAKDDKCPHCAGTGLNDEAAGQGPVYECGVCGGSGKKSSNVRVADGQGPQTDDQKALMAQALQEQGRGDEVPQMIINPAQYAREFADLIGKETPPEIEGGQAPAPPVAAPPAADPTGGMGGPPPGAGGPQMAMARALDKYADKDHIQQHGDNFDNSLDVPAADQEHQDNLDQEQDPSHHWVDEDGQPLKVGQEYEMYSQDYDIPDMVRIEAVKPDSIEFTLTGEYGLDHRTEVTWQEAQMEGYSFTNASADHADELGGTDQPSPDTMDSMQTRGPGDQTDLSSPHQMAYSNTHEASPFMLYEQNGAPCPQCQQPTHTNEATGTNWCENCRLEVPQASAPPVPANRDPSRAVIPDAGTFDHTASERDWLMKDAGAKFTPYEQKEFIEEAGVARNADKMDLRGTHYEASRSVEVDPDDFLFGL